MSVAACRSWSDEQCKRLSNEPQRLPLGGSMLMEWHARAETRVIGVLNVYGVESSLSMTAVSAPREWST